MKSRQNQRKPKKNNPTCGKERNPQPMRIVGPIQFWRGWMIFSFLVKLRKKINKITKKTKQKKICGVAKGTDERTCKFGSTYKPSYEFWSTYKHTYERTYESGSTYKCSYVHFFAPGAYLLKLSSGGQ